MRFIAPWKDSKTNPAIYHCISRVVERRFAFGSEEREEFRMFMRMQENFSGCPNHRFQSQVPRKIEQSPCG